MNVWFFQASPKRYRLLECLVNPNISILTWEILPEYFDKVKKGDLALIWMSGESAGIYAVARILSSPEVISCKAGEKQYFVNRQDKLRKKALRVEIKIFKKMIDSPIYRTKLKKINGLRGLGVLGYWEKTNLLVKKEYRRIIDRAIIR